MIHQSDNTETVYSRESVQEQYAQIGQFFQKLNSDLTYDFNLLIEHKQSKNHSQNTRESPQKLQDCFFTDSDSFELFTSVSVESSDYNRKSDDFADLMNKFTSEEIERRLEAADVELSQIEL